ncbi:dTDP-4-dehydrorhamnose 3,5-epimerase [Lachnospiraceae bacterium]|nr:dTDP-4-dehydrorhamnose 3,5-epimerase [Lachnospiraceae bacterium]
MGKIDVIHNVGGLKGLTIIIPKAYEDNRGYLMESFNNDDLAQIGITDSFVQDNEAFSKKDVLRGFHVNRSHPQAKLIRVLDGEIYDVVIDLRSESKTYKKWYGIILSSENKKQLYIPEGFGHGYLALSDARVLFKVTTHWVAGDEISFAWNSNEFEINWPVWNPIQNDNDRNSPDFSTLII